MGLGFAFGVGALLLSGAFFEQAGVLIRPNLVLLGGTVVAGFF